ncbi:hypothetical protein LX32DRAFT_389352 [Colletotrichum zoysiae]|uniref:Uncharacterized protein n=1 Tax=Colletotrichum zoysiae TaxID=1216348 RepID=A0AAD9M118_9PEZI|nr:hypothetical protein LX32DRAFT_389352 [Colletotrichum zoysiae]
MNDCFATQRRSACGLVSVQRNPPPLTGRDDIPVGDPPRLPASGAGQGQGTEANLGTHRASFNDVSSPPRDDTSKPRFSSPSSANQHM